MCLQGGRAIFSRPAGATTADTLLLSSRGGTQGDPQATRGTDELEREQGAHNARN
jgi:hypothetical protein